MAIATLVAWIGKAAQAEMRLDASTLLGREVTLASANGAHRLPPLWLFFWPTLDAMCARTLKRAGRPASRPSNPADSARHARATLKLQTRIAQAGLPAAVLPDHVRAARRLFITFIVLALAATSAVSVWIAGVGEFSKWLLDGKGATPGSTSYALFIGAAAAIATVWRVWPDLWLRRRAGVRAAQIDRQLPLLLDLLVLGVRSGLNLQGALAEAVAQGQEGALREEVARCLADMRAGQRRALALEALAARVPSQAVQNWVAAMRQADSLGMSIAPLLQAQAENQRNVRFERAERLALEAPVKMLFPLIVFIFPCTFIVIAFPIFHSMRAGL